MGRMIRAWPLLPWLLLPLAAVAQGTVHRCVGQLQQALLAAFASHRADQLSGLILWQGYGDRQALDGIARLQALLRQPLLGLQQDGQALRVSTPSEQADGQPRQSRFALRQQAGCLWLSPPD